MRHKERESSQLYRDQDLARIWANNTLDRSAFLTLVTFIRPLLIDIDAVIGQTSP